MRAAPVGLDGGLDGGLARGLAWGLAWGLSVVVVLAPRGPLPELAPGTSRGALALLVWGLVCGLPGLPGGPRHGTPRPVPWGRTLCRLALVLGLAAGPVTLALALDQGAGLAGPELGVVGLGGAALLVLLAVAADRGGGSAVHAVPFAVAVLGVPMLAAVLAGSARGPGSPVLETLAGGSPLAWLLGVAREPTLAPFPWLPLGVASALLAAAELGAHRTANRRANRTDHREDLGPTGSGLEEG